MRASWLNLHLWIPQRDVRKIIYGLLNKYDRIMVECAHLSHLKIQKMAGHKIAKQCAKRGYLSLFKWVVGRSGCKVTDGHFLIAVENGQTSVVEYILIVRKPHLQSYYCEVAARCGHLSVLKLLNRYDCPWYPIIVCSCAALNGHAHILDWLLSIGIEISVSEYGYQRCVEKGHTAVLKWLENHK